MEQRLYISILLRQYTIYFECTSKYFFILFHSILDINENFNVLGNPGMYAELLKMLPLTLLCNISNTLLEEYKNHRTILFPIEKHSFVVIKCVILSSKTMNIFGDVYMTVHIGWIQDLCIVKSCYMLDR